jgi:hypothetical protein
LLIAQATEIIMKMPSAAPFIASMSKFIEDNSTYNALKEARKLVYHERDLFEHQRNRVGAA